MSKKAFVKSLIVALVALSVLITGCGQPAAAPKADPKAAPKVDPATKTITFAISVDIDTLDPQQMSTEYYPHSLMFSYPVTLGLKRDQPYPSMVKSVEMSKDGTVMTFVFPDDMKLSNGKKVTGTDFVKAMERYKKVSPYASDFDEVKEMKAEGQKVMFTFKAPTSYFWPVVATAYTAFVDWEEAEKVGKEAFGQKPIGFGPFVLKEWVRGSQVVLTKNPNFVDHTPFIKNKGPWNFDTAVVRIIPDNFTRIKELEAGNVDVSDVPAEFVEQIKANSKIKLISAVRAGEAYLRFNTQNAPFNNAKFRQAVNYAINRDEIKTASKGGMEPVYGLLSPSQLCYSAETEAELKNQNKTDVAKAKALLAELGYKDTNNDGYLDKGGQKLSFTLQGTTVNRVPLTVIQAQLKNVGIEIKIMEQPNGVINQSIKDRKFDMTLSTWSWSDPDIWFYGLHSSGSTGTAVWHSKETDKMLVDQRTQVDPKVRTATWSALSKKIGQELPVVPLFYYINYTGIRANIEGYQVAVNGSIYFNDAVKK